MKGCNILLPDSSFGTQVPVSSSGINHEICTFICCSLNLQRINCTYDYCIALQLHQIQREKRVNIYGDFHDKLDILSCFVLHNKKSANGLISGSCYLGNKLPWQLHPLLRSSQNLFKSFQLGLMRQNLEIAFRVVVTCFPV